MSVIGKAVARRLPFVRDLFGERDGLIVEHALPTAADPRAAPTLPEPYRLGGEHAKTATAEDIFYCFRLLLGRNPNPEEWLGHASRAGEDLESVISSYVTSREFAARGLLNKTYRDQVQLVGFPRFSIFASHDDLAIGHHVAAGNPYEPGITATLERYTKSGMAVVDVGANIGCLTMLLASLVGPSGLVVAVEPNPENIKLLEASRRVNGFEHVLVIHAAAGRQTGVLALNVSHSNGMTGELPADLDAVFASHPVPCFALDAILPKDRPFGLIKVDTEGAELNVLTGLSDTIVRDRPVIVSEFSPATLPGISRCSGPEYLRFLIAKGYRMGVIEQDGSETSFGDDIDGVMCAYSRSGIDHIDIIAMPS